jgi:hypothetical protein
VNHVVPDSVVRGPRARKAPGLFIAVGAVLLLVAPVAAQSPSPSAAPDVSAAPASAAPATSPGPSVGGLASLEASFAAQACDPLITADEVAAVVGGQAGQGPGGRGTPEARRPGFYQLDCSWTIDGGHLWLTVDEREWKARGKPKAKDLYSARQLATIREATRIEDLGTVAYSDPGSEFGLVPGRPSVTWAQWAKRGKVHADRQLRLYSDVADVTLLEQLARIVRSDAAPGDPPGPVALDSEAAALVGSWTLSGWYGPPWGLPESTILTIAFEADGTTTTTFDCRQAGSKPLITTGLVFVDGDRITTVPDGRPSSGTCSPGDGDPFDIETRIMVSRAPTAIRSGEDATWAIDGDTLTVSGSGFYLTLTFDRAS